MTLPPPPPDVLPLGIDPETLEALNETIRAAKPFVPGGARAVFGEGPIGARFAFVGEQPGDQEDLQGRPFVGPAGQLLDRALADAEIVRGDCYVTNAVKHFKFVQRGKRRIHQKPTAGEVRHYRWWLMKELEFVAPALVVALGSTAAYALAGRPIAVLKERGMTPFGFVTVHPSMLLRIPDPAARQDAYRSFVGDLKQAKALADEQVETSAR